MKLTVTDAAKQWGITRNTVYNNINNGKLSRDANKMIDVVEMIRVFGEPNQNKRVDISKSTHDLALNTEHINTQELQHQLELEQLKTKHLEELLKNQELINKDYRQQIEHYQRQIEQMNDNLSKANMSIQELAQSRLIGMKPEEKTEEAQSNNSDINKKSEKSNLESFKPNEQIVTSGLTPQKKKKWRWW